jgi:hypothetical protein
MRQGVPSGSSPARKKRLYQLSFFIFISLCISFHLLLLQTWGEIADPISFIFDGSLLEFLSVSHQFPKITDPFDIMRWVPFDSQGCPRNRFILWLTMPDYFQLKT